jgi:hypothetical protein
VDRASQITATRNRRALQEVVAAHGSVVLIEDTASAIGLGVALAEAAAQHAPAAAGGDLAQLLDIDVHQIAGPLRVHSSNHSAGGPIKPPQFG